MSKTLADFYHRHRKTVNDNVGLIIALVASAAAVLAVREARLTRADAAKVADQSLKVQQESVQAQIATMRLDERPYVRAATVGLKMADQSDRDTYDYQAIFKLFSIGRTPATFLGWNVYCGLLQANQLAGVAQTEKEAEAKATTGEVLMLGESGLTRVTNSEAVVNNGDKLEVNCPFSKKDYQSSKDKEKVEIDPNKQITEDQSTMMTFIIDVVYSDVFDSKHRTQQCFYVPSGDDPLHKIKKLLSCKQFKVTIE